LRKCHVLRWLHLTVTFRWGRTASRVGLGALQKRKYNVCEGFRSSLTQYEQGLAAVREIAFRPPRQPMPNFILVMKLITKVQSSLSSPNKSNIEKQKLKHGFRPPVLRHVNCSANAQL
jgi:hypothetical protein